MNVPSTAFKDIKCVDINTKSETNKASENVIGMKNLISPGMNKEPISTAAPTIKEASPVPLLNKFPISPIKSVKKLNEVTLSIFNIEFRMIDPKEHPTSALHI